MSEKILQNLLDESIASFRSYKKLAEAAIEQVTDEEFFKTIDAESNNIAAIIKHLGGNLRSRWSDFWFFRIFGARSRGFHRLLFTSALTA